MWNKAGHLLHVEQNRPASRALIRHTCTQEPKNPSTFSPTSKHRLLLLIARLESPSKRIFWLIICLCFYLLIFGNSVSVTILSSFNIFLYQITVSLNKKKARSGRRNREKNIHKFIQSCSPTRVDVPIYYSSTS